MEDQPTTIDELKARIERARSDLQKSFAGLSDEQLVVRSGEEWAIVDHLAHLAAWERGIADYLRGRSRAVGMGLGEDAWDLPMDEVNARIFHQNEGLSAVQARQSLRQAQEQMNDALAGLDDGDLARDYGEFLPAGEDSPYAERTVLQTIAGNTFEHYDEHAAYIRDKLDEIL